MRKLWLKDISFLEKSAKDSQREDEILRLLHQIEDTKVENRDYYLIDLDESETDLMEDFLSDLIGEIGIGEDGEVNHTGRYIDDLIDIFNTRDSK